MKECPLLRITVTLAAIMLVVALTLPGRVAAMGMSVDIMPNFIGGGIGVTSEWSGSRESMVGVVPAARVKWDNNRFVEWYALYAGVNLIDSGGWEFGPAAIYRLGRKDVKDDVVKLLPEIGSAFDLGLFGGYSYVNAGDIPFRVRVGVTATAIVLGSYSGTNVSPYLTTWVPLHPKVFVGLGVGATWANASYMNTYYGVTPTGSAASGLQEYSPGGGFRQIYAWPALLVKVSDAWYVGTGAYYQRLTGGAANSPIVEQRGSCNQWTYGAGLGYSWQ